MPFIRIFTGGRPFLPCGTAVVSFTRDARLSSSSLDLFTDASPATFGTYFAGEWFSCSFTDHLIPLSRSTTFEELYAISTAVSTWAPSLASWNTFFYLDNQSVVHILSSGTIHCKHIMFTCKLHYLFYVCASHNIMLRTVHIPGMTNCFADCLSRLQVTKFHRLCSTASKHPTLVPVFPWPTSYKCKGVLSLWFCRLYSPDLRRCPTTVPQLLWWLRLYSLTGIGRHINLVHHLPDRMHKTSGHQCLSGQCSLSPCF